MHKDTNVLCTVFELFPDCMVLSLLVFLFFTGLFKYPLLSRLYVVTYCILFNSIVISFIVCLFLLSVCLPWFYISWLFAYLTQLNPLVGPAINANAAAHIRRVWASSAPPEGLNDYTTEHCKLMCHENLGSLQRPMLPATYLGVLISEVLLYSLGHWMERFTVLHNYRASYKKHRWDQ